MKQMLTFLIVLLLGAVPMMAADFELDVKTVMLDNGLTLLMHQDNSVPTVSVQTFVNAGSRDEDKPGATGLAHVFEHMMFRGTEKFPVYSDAVAPLGAQNNAYTTEDYTCYFINAKASFLGKMLEVESDRIRNLVFTDKTFRTELGPVKEERRMSVDDDPHGFLEVQLLREAFTKHTYQHPVIGWEEDLEIHMTFEDGLEFKNRFYVPNNCVLVIAGNIEPAETEQLVRKYYQDWPAGTAYAAQIESEPQQTEERIKNFAWKDDQISPLILIGYHAYSVRADLEKMATLKLINEILFSRSGRLTRVLKNNLALVERIGGDAGMKKDPALEVISARLKRGASLDEVSDTVYAHLETLKSEPVPAEEIKRAANNLRAQMIYRLNRPARIAGSIGYYHLIGGDYGKMFELYDLYEKVSAAMIMAVANEVFDKFNRTVVTLSPKSVS